MGLGPLPARDPDRVAGVAIFNGRTWARIVGCVLALASTITNLAFIAAYPAWSIIVIAIDVLVIYSLCMHGGELRHDT